MDPLTLGMTALSAIKAASAVRKDLGAIASDIGKVMDACSALRKPPKKKIFADAKSVEAEALEVFANKKKAEQIENEMRNHIISIYGRNGWDQVIRIQGSIRKERQRAEIEAQNAKRKKIELFFSVIVITAFGVAAFLILFFIWKIATH